jgi:hypothetical protein
MTETNTADAVTADTGETDETTTGRDTSAARQYPLTTSLRFLMQRENRGAGARRPLTFLTTPERTAGPHETHRDHPTHRTRALQIEAGDYETGKAQIEAQVAEGWQIL